MSQMIDLGKELLRISLKDDSKLEYSTNAGKTWHVRFSGSSSTGDFQDLTEKGNEILANTTKGLFYSSNEGRTWHKRS